MEHHLRPLLVITILAVLLAGTGYMLWPQASKAPTTKQGLQQASSTAHELGPYSLRDGKVWYVNDEELVGASPATFSFVGGNFFGKDAAHVFYRATEISGADTGSFTPVFDDKGNAPLYSKDRNHVYVSSPQSQITSVMQSADAATFVAFDADNPKSCGDNCSYDAEDKNHTYLQGKVVQNDGMYVDSKVSAYSASDTQALTALAKKSCSSCQIYPEQQWATFYMFGVGDENGSYTMVAQKQTDGTFIKLYTEQEEPTCAQIQQYKVPHQIEPKCYQDGQLIDNSL